MKWIVAAVLTIIAVTSFAESRGVPMMYQMVAQENAVPAKLFFAMIMNESRSKSRQITHTEGLPWPWTINHRGTPHYFATRKDAHQFALSLIAKEDTRFDIGLGQLNWRWHSNRFRDVWSALDPYTNLSVAAEYLREQYERPECATWILAVGCYHRSSQMPADRRIAKSYREKVVDLWSKI
jgi:hypothetical protein